MKHTFFIAVLLMILETASGETWYVDQSVTLPGKGTSWKTAFKTIQEGIDASGDRDTVIVAEGTYVETIEFKGKNITLTSTDPLDLLVRDNTIVDGKGAGSVVTFSGAENKGCVLSGFTIRDGKAESGGGIVGHGALATIRNNTITGNSASEDGGGLSGCGGTIQNNAIIGNSAGFSGGALHGCGGTIQNNVIMGNSAERAGGGLFGCGGTIQNNVISGNSAGTNGYGGGLHDCDGTVQHNTISNNSAVLDGGGLYQCDGTMQNNTITGNSARYGGGLYWCGGTIQNNAITGNSAGHSGGGLGACEGTIRHNVISANKALSEGSFSYGGGVYQCGGAIQNNDITGNSADDDGGGLAFCDGTIQNNRISGNSAQRGGGLAACNEAIRNNTIAGNSADGFGGGLLGCEGAIQNCIIWGNTAWRDDQLSGSAVPTYSCIQDWSAGGEGSIAEDPRFLDSDGPDNDPETYGDNDYRLSMGSPCIDAGSNQSWMGLAVDLDGNPRIFHGGSSLTVDMGAYEYGFFLFRVTEVLREAGGQRQLIWNSRARDTYIIWSRAHLSFGEWVEEATAPSQGANTSWTDVGLFGGQRFYRIELK